MDLNVLNSDKGEMLVVTTQLPLSELRSEVLGSKLVDFSYQMQIFCLLLGLKNLVSAAFLS